MDISRKNEIAAFRYGLISGVVNRVTPLSPGEITAYFREVSQRTLEIPDSSRKSICIRTLERYKADYEKHGLEGLMPKDMPRRGVSVLVSEILDRAAFLRKERPERSVEQIIFILRQEGLDNGNKISASTLSRYFRNSGLSRKKFLKESISDDVYRRYETSAPHIVWQSDFKHSVYLPDPANPKKKKRTKLCCIIDDFSRYIIHGQFYWDEKVPALEDCLKKAVLKYGMPEQFYCDNGSSFSSKHISNICARLGVRLSHSKAYRPAGRGKIERFFQFVDSSFTHEVYSEIEKGDMTTIEELNKAFQTWLNGYYHTRKSSVTKQTPNDRIQQTAKEPRHLPVDTLMRMFFVSEYRVVDKTGCISLNGQVFEVSPDLSGEKAELRYDPFDTSVVEIWHCGSFRGHAKFLNAADNFNNYSERESMRPTPRQTMNRQTEVPGAAEIETKSFLDAARAKMLDDCIQLKLSYVEDKT